MIQSHLDSFSMVHECLPNRPRLLTVIWVIDRPIVIPCFRGIPHYGEALLGVNVIHPLFRNRMA